MKKFVQYQHNNTYLGLLYVWIVSVSTAYSFIAVQIYNKLESATYDLGFFDQIFWQLSHFQWPYVSLYNRFFLGDHLTLTLPLLATLYWVWNDVRVILIFQAVWLGLSSLAIYKLSVHRKFSSLFSFALAFSYSLFFGIQSAIFDAFHPVSFAVGLLAWLLYCLESEKKRWFWICLVLFLFTQENMGLALACVGVIYFFYNKYRKVAVWFILGGLAYTGLATWIVSIFSPIGYEYIPALSSDFATNILGLFDHADKRLVWTYSLTAFLLLPIFSPGAMIAMSLDLWQFFVAGNMYDWMRPPSAYHRAMLAIFLALGTLEVMGKVVHRRYFQQFVSYALIVVTIGSVFVFRQPVLNIFSSEFYVTVPWIEDARKLFARVPTEYAVATYQNFGPYLSHRNVLYIVEPKIYGPHDNPCELQSDCWWLDIPLDAHYLVVTSDTAEERSMMRNFDTFQTAVMNMERVGRLREIDREGRVVIYKIYR